ncbi:MAG: S-layer homology domain-containing protein [Candidatus Metalachnospira sp.]|nr:S-layer homology domain-containing protein [Candidatus Metalachnospira sp.]
MRVHRMKAVSMALAFSMTLGVCSFTAFADEPEELWVNGVNILVDDDKTVECGEGTAVYDEDTNTLTLDNATIESGEQHTGICHHGTIEDVLKIKLIGTNTMGGELQRAIFSFSPIEISGRGTLEAELKNKGGNFQTNGIAAYQGIEVKDIGISLKFNDTGKGLNGFDSSGNWNGYIRMNNCEVSVDGFEVGISAMSNEININSCEINMKKVELGISGSGTDTDGNYLIKDSTIDISLDSNVALTGHDIVIDSSELGVNGQIYSENTIDIIKGSDITADSTWPALYAEEDISVNKSKVFATCDTGTAIYTENDMKIENGSEIKAKGYYRALQSVGSMTLSDSKINAVSTNDIAIWSLNKIELDNEVYAKGGAGYPAIAVRYQKADGDNEPEAKITLNKDYTEESGGKISASDWYEDNGKTYSWTSFIAKNGDGKLATDFSNGLNEANIIKVKEVEKKSSGSSHSLEEKKGGNKERPAEEPADTNQESGPFSDVNKDTPNYDAIIKVYENGWMEGIGNGIFAPNGTLTRGMAAQILWNVAGKPESDGISPFLDVTADKYYARAVAWAYEQGIILGYDETTFGPEDYVTIEQFEIMMAKYKDMTPAPYTGASPNATRGYVAGAIVL